MSFLFSVSLWWSRLPNTMAQNLSVPLAFVALLHLANEKVSFVLKTAILNIETASVGDSPGKVEGEKIKRQIDRTGFENLKQ